MRASLSGLVFLFLFPFFFFRSSNKDLSETKTILKRGKAKKIKRKTAQNPQISKKTKLLVKKPYKNLHVSKKCSKFAGAM